MDEFPYFVPIFLFFLSFHFSFFFWFPSFFAFAVDLLKFNSEKEIAPHLFRLTYLFLSFFFLQGRKKFESMFPALSGTFIPSNVCLSSGVGSPNISASLKVQMHHFELLLLDLGNDVWFQLISHFVLQVEFRLFHCKLRSRSDPSVGKS